MRYAYYLFIFLVPLTGISNIYELPKPPSLSPAGFKLILDGETGGEREYNKNPHPEWPGGSSGITWGIGYDSTAQAESIIFKDWSVLPHDDLNKLAKTHPYRGYEAKIRLHEVRGILVSWKDSVGVFNNVDLVRTWQLCIRYFPGFETLRPNAQAAIISLVFNRGASFSGPNRKEMRDIREAVPNHDYQAMADAEISMKRIWRGTDIENGMNNRRNAEAKLFLTP